MDAMNPINETNNMSVSVVIPVKNGESKIGRCLEAIINQTYKPLEIIVVDGFSTDNTIQIAAKYSVKVVFENYGTIGGARQVGLENAKGYYIAFTDADCAPEPNWLYNLINSFTDDTAGIGGGTRNIGEGLWQKSISYALDSFFGSANSVQDRVFSEKQIVKSISGSNSIYRRRDLIAINGFNVNLSINEDTELNSRIMKVGKLLYIPNAIVLHDQNRNLLEFARRMYRFGYGRARSRLFDVQVVPPIVAIIVFLFLFISIKYFLFFILVYLIIMFAFDIHILYNTKNILFLISIPIVFIIEHSSYTLGFWRGMAENVKWR